MSNFSHAGSLHYNLDVALEDNFLLISLTITESEKIKKFKDFFVDYSLPKEVKIKLGTVQNLFSVLQNKKNFTINPVKGSIFLW